MCGISGRELMRRAAASCWAVIRERSPVAATIAIVCGPGNNGGAGYEIARLATQDNWIVPVYALDGVPQAGDAQRAYAAWCAGGSVTVPFMTDTRRVGDEGVSTCRLRGSPVD